MKPRLTHLSFILFMLGFPFPTALKAATFTVTTHEDTVGNLGYALSLREAILSSNSTPGPNKIVISSEVEQHIVLTMGALIITNEVEIDGTSTIPPVLGKNGGEEKILSGPIQVSGNNLSQVFIVSSGAGNVVIRNMIVAEGNATFYEGGGIRVDPNSNVTLQDVVVRDCQAVNGGGIYSNQSNLALTNCNIRDNQANGGAGGGVSSSGGDLSLYQCEVMRNGARIGGGIFCDNGGGFSREGDIAVVDSEISGNTASEDGGGIHVSGLLGNTITNTTITGNTALENGGGTYTNNARTNTLINATITHNTAGDGSAESFSEGSGGGIYISSSSVLSATNVAISENVATLDGGGLYNVGRSNITLVDSTVDGNRLEHDGSYFGSGYGGGIYHEGGGMFTLVDTQITKNSTYNYGGGVFYEYGEFNATRATISRNTARYIGGLSASGDVTLTECQIHNNQAETTGGMYVGGNVTLIDCRVHQNGALRGVGGMSTGLGVFTMVDSEITENETLEGSGGGLTVYADFNDLRPLTTIVDVIGGKITGNRSSYGGGLCLSGNLDPDRGGTETSLANVLIADNTAVVSGGGIYTGPHVSLTIGDSNIESNSSGLSGGGIFNRGSTTINGSILSENESNNGGGVFNVGVLGFRGSILSGNKAMSNGAGILSGTDSTTKIVNTTLSGNWTENGSGGAISAEQNTVMDVVHTTIANNYANSSGGGIHVSTATVRMGNSILAGNTTNATGSDLHGDLTSLDYNLIEDLSNGKLIGPVANTIVGVDPRLGLLADNGGPSLTHNLLSGSPAIDSGGNGLAFDEGLVADQRGFFRISDISSVPNRNGGVDMGAVEIIAIQIDDAAAVEGSGQIEFTITLSNLPPVSQEVFVLVSTASFSGGAVATDDYTPIVSERIVFSSSGPLSQIISVPIVDDAEYEPNENFHIVLSEAYGATIFDVTATGTIIDNDPPPTATPTPTSTPTGTPTDTTPLTPTPTPTPTSTPSSTSVQTATETPTEEPSFSPTPHFDYDFDSNGVIDARDLYTLFPILDLIEKADPFDFSKYWMTRKTDQ